MTRLIGHKTAIFLVILTLFALSIRLHKLQVKPLDMDEKTSILMKKLNVSEIIHQTIIGDCHPPLFYLLSKSALTMTPDMITAVRLPAVIAGTLTIPMLWMLSARLCSHKCAWIAALLLTLNPFHIETSQLGRMYAQLGFCFVASLIFLEELIIRPGFNRYFWLLLASLTAGLYSQYVFWVMPVLLSIRLLWLYRKIQIKDKTFAGNDKSCVSSDASEQTKGMMAVKTGFSAIIISIILFNFWFLTVYYFNAGSSSLDAKVAIFHGLSVKSVATAISSFSLGSLPESEGLRFLSAAASLLCIIPVLFYKKKEGSRIIILIFIVPLILHLAVSFLFMKLYDSTVFVARYMSVITPALCALTACALHSALNNKKRILLAIFPIIIILGQLRGMTLFLTGSDKSEMAYAFNVIKSFARKGDMIVLSPVLSTEYMEIYYSGINIPLFNPSYWNPLQSLVSPKEFGNLLLTDSKLIKSKNEMIKLMEKNLKENGLFKHRRVWFVDGHKIDAYRSPKDKAIYKYLDQISIRRLLDIYYDEALIGLSLWEMNPGSK